MKSLTVSRYLEIDCNYIFPGCANPHDATTQEGIKIGEIAKLWDEVCADSFPELNNKYGLNIDFGHGINGLFGEGNYFNANLENENYGSGMDIMIIQRYVKGIFGYKFKTKCFCLFYYDFL